MDVERGTNRPAHIDEGAAVPGLTVPGNRSSLAAAERHQIFI
jgi:hypothetical protein